MLGDDTPELRKARGAFFTPLPIAEYLARWAIRDEAARVLEPSAGEAVFIEAAARRLRSLGTAGTITGVELHADSARHAGRLLSAAGVSGEVITSDFFTADLEPNFDAVIGNPPFVRYQDFTGESRLAAQQAALELGVRLTGLSSSWAAFVVRTASLLAPGGRLALVLPAELLSVGYASDVRRFLLDHFGTLRLITFERLVFDGALEDVVLLLAEGTGGTDGFDLYQARDLDDLPPAEDGWVSNRADEAKWVDALLPLDAIEAYRRISAEPEWTSLGAWGRPYLGAVSGNNRWFTMTDGQVAEEGLRPSEVKRISPPGSKHLRGLEFSTAAWDGLRRDGRPVFLFDPPTTDDEELSEGARRRIERGEHEGVHQAYKCRVRSPWWRVPLPETGDLLLTYMNHQTPRLVTNSAKVAHLNSIHAVALDREHRDLGRDLLPLAALNSLTLLGAELIGRAYGGGVLKVEPGEALHLPLPSPALVADCADDLRAIRPQVGVFLRAGKVVEAARLVDKAIRAHTPLRRDDLASLRDGRRHLFERRTGRGRRSPDPAQQQLPLDGEPSA